MKRLIIPVVLLTALTALGGCDRLGIPDPARQAAIKDAEGKAIGSACRHSGRALEDCFTLNPSALKSSVFAGWREMNDYMLQNKLDTVAPTLTSPGLAALQHKLDAAQDQYGTAEADQSDPTLAARQHTWGEE